MSDLKFLNNYFDEIRKLLSEEKYFEDLVKVKDILIKTHSEGKKTMIFGNGGSAAIGSHFSVDLTKNARVRCTNYNESDLLTCFSNDFGYDNWVSEAVKFYSKSNDALVLISVSGESPSVINAAKTARDLGIPIITFSGRDINNSLKSLGDINFWVDSHAYNIVECIHMIWVTTVIDALIGKAEYEVS